LWQQVQPSPAPVATLSSWIVVSPMVRIAVTTTCSVTFKQRHTNRSPQLPTDGQVRHSPPQGVLVSTVDSSAVIAGKGSKAGW
jgi:hypothetical protein